MKYFISLLLLAITVPSFGAGFDPLNPNIQGVTVLTKTNPISIGPYNGSLTVTNGKVGIGTTSPGVTLEVSGTIKSTGNSYLQVYSTEADAPLSYGIQFKDGYNAIHQDTSHNLNFDVYNGGSSISALNIQNNGRISILTSFTVPSTITTPGTTGNQTINKPSGRVNIAAGGSSVVVTNSLCTTASIVIAQAATADATAYVRNTVPGTGQFTITLGAAATAETAISYFLVN